MESILTSIKKLLGLQEDDTSFDTDIIIHINSVFMILNQLGVGPVEGFTIEDKTKTWTDYLGTDKMLISGVKSYIYLKVRLIFDPPTISAVLDAMKRETDGFEWRLNQQVEGGTTNG
jgi:hypothetical protein